MKVTKLNTEETEADTTLRSCLGMFETFILIGVDIAGDIQDVHYVTSESEKVMLSRIQNQRIGEKLARDFPEEEE